jgi:hypothetical protein
MPFDGQSVITLNVVKRCGELLLTLRRLRHIVADNEANR